MKKILSLIILCTVCFTMVSCSAATLTGELKEFTNANQSFSIQLPAEDPKDEDAEPVWTINEKTDGDTLAMVDSQEIVNIQVQCASKKKAVNIASDLEAYKGHITGYTLADVFTDKELKETKIATPDFITSSMAYEFDAGKNTEGNVIFMESSSSYYTYLILTAKGGYDANKDVIQESIMSLKEITTTPQQ